MIHYIDGAQSAVGDTILIDNGARTGQVVAVIQDAADMCTWGLHEPGLMIESDYYGLLFVPADQISDLECRLMARSTKP